MTDVALPAGAPAPDFPLPPTSGSRSPSSAAGRSSSPSTPRTGARSAATGWGSTTPSCRISTPGAELLGISADGPWRHAAFAADRKLHFPLLADFEPKGAVAASYGVYDARDGICRRALFVLDGEGVIRWSYVSPMGVNPGADAILAAREALSPKETAR